MKLGLHSDRRATVALEFALVAPAMLALFMGAVALCVAMWTLSVLQGTAEQTARCSAIGSTACATVTAGCDSGSPVVCFAEKAAADRGVASVTASEVTVSAPTIGGVSFNAVAIAHSFNLLGYQLTLNASGLFPTNVISWAN